MPGKMRKKKRTRNKDDFMYELDAVLRSKLYEAQKGTPFETKWQRIARALEKRGVK